MSSVALAERVTTPLAGQPLCDGLDRGGDPTSRERLNSGATKGMDAIARMESGNLADLFREAERRRGGITAEILERDQARISATVRASGHPPGSLPSSRNIAQSLER